MLSRDGTSVEASQDSSEVVDPDRSGWELAHSLSSPSTCRVQQSTSSGRGAFKGSLHWIMPATIFSRSSEVIWRSLRLRLLAQESCLRILGRAMSRAGVSEQNSTASSSTTESRLPDSSGTSSDGEDRLDWRICLGMAVAAVESGAAVSSQQIVSLVHRRQLRFSSRRPCCTDPAHLAKTVAIC